MTPARLLLFCLIFLISPYPAHGAAEPLPLAGKGVLVIPAASSAEEVPLYEFPGVRRMGTFPLRQLPLLNQVVRTRDGETVIAVSALKEGWARVASEASGRQGWLAIRQGWSCLPWERFLPGRTVRCVAGLKDPSYRLRAFPSGREESGATVSPGFPLHVHRVQDDWAELDIAGRPLGWLRWRDGDGRLLVTVD